MAQLGADVVWVDWEQSSCGIETMITIRILSFKIGTNDFENRS